MNNVLLRLLRWVCAPLAAVKTGLWQLKSALCDVTTLLPDRHGQTSVDLVMAVSLFFIGMAILTVTSPLLFFPSDLSVTDERVTADTVANELLNDELADPGGAGISHEQTSDFATGGDVSTVTSAAPDQDVLVVLSVDDSTDAPPVFNSEGASSNGRLEIEVGTEPQQLSTTVERRTTLHTKTVKVTVEVGSEK